jgi:ubiquinone/menaquinone biosynthesis C-methylase UbiE
MWDTNLKVDVECDLTKFPWPFDDSCADEILMNHVLEHLLDTRRTMIQIKRILKPGGIFHGVIPVGNSLNGQTHWQHYRFFNKGTFKDLANSFGMELVYAKFGSLTDTPLKRLRNLVPFRELLYKAGWGNAYDLVYFKLEK